MQLCTLNGKQKKILIINQTFTTLYLLLTHLFPSEQIGTKADWRAHHGRMVLFLGNKNTAPLDSVQAVILPPANLKLELSLVPETIPPRAQVRVSILIFCFQYLCVTLLCIHSSLTIIFRHLVVDNRNRFSFSLCFYVAQVQCPLEVVNLRPSRDVAVLDFSYKFTTTVVLTLQDSIFIHNPLCFKYEIVFVNPIM